MSLGAPPLTAHHGLTLNPDGTRLCAAGTVADYVAILSVPELDLLSTTTVGTEPSWAISSLDGRYCYVSSRKSDDVSIISFEDGRELAVFRLTDPEALHVIDNECPHAGGDLAAGRVEQGLVYCPWHEWGFSLISGISTHSSEARVKTYPCCVRDGDVYAQL